MSLENKIDFAIIFSVKNANPNGDPLNDNRPRIDYKGFGEVSDVCIKRKIRNRLMADGHTIFVQSDDNKIDGMSSLKERAESSEFGLGKDAFNSKKTKPEQTGRMACEKWLDVRSFGQLFAFKGSKNDGVSIGIRGPVTIQSAFSVKPVSITSNQITKSVNGEPVSKKSNKKGNNEYDYEYDYEDNNRKSSDRFGMKHRVDEATYVIYGSMSPQLAERTGFSNDDAEAIKKVLPKLFEGDASSARPEGSMKVGKVIWWKHNSKAGKCSSWKVHESLTVKEDGSYKLDIPKGLKEGDLVPEEIDGV